MSVKGHWNLMAVDMAAYPGPNCATSLTAQPLQVTEAGHRGRTSERQQPGAISGQPGQRKRLLWNPHAHGQQSGGLQHERDVA
jgi:hypothetical protein